MSEIKEKIEQIEARVAEHVRIVRARVDDYPIDGQQRRRYSALGAGLLAHAVMWSTIAYIGCTGMAQTMSLETTAILFGGMALSSLLIFPLYRYMKEVRGPLFRIGRISF